VARRRRRSTARTSPLFVVVAVCAASAARADDDPPSDATAIEEPAQSDDEDPASRWVSGPEAPVDDDEENARTSPPRELGAPPWDLTVPPRVDAPLQPIVPFALRERPDPRMSTTFSRERLRSTGDLALADALVSMPGLWLIETGPSSTHLRARGLDSEHTAVTLDGIPLLPSFAFPTFPILTHLALDDVEQVTLRHGGRVGLGVEGAAGGVLDVRTLPAPRDLGEELPLTGTARAGMGGADLEKQAALTGDVGFGRARIGMSGSVFHREDRRLGRGDGVVPASEGFGGHLAARGDILVDTRTRVVGLWRSSRQARTPEPLQCVPDETGRRVDCVTLHDRAIDLLGVGLDVTRPLGPVRLDVTSRAHAQRVSEEYERTGVALFFASRTKDELWRAGALVDTTLSLAPFSVFVDEVVPSITIGAEGLRDRVTSTSAVRSQRFGDGAAAGEFIDVPGDAPLVDGDRVLGKGTLGAALEGHRGHVKLLVVAGAQALTIDGEDARLARGIGGRELAPFYEGELAARARLVEQAAVFGALFRVDRPDTLFHRTRGRLLLADDAPRALPMSREHARFVEHGGEAGLDLSWAFVDVVGQLFLSARDGAIARGADATETLMTGEPVDRFVRGPRRLVGGVEGTARVRPFFDGLSVEATLGAHAIDEGLFFATTGLFSPTPASGVLNPGGALLLRYAPRAWPLETFARARYALPLARLSPDEESDPTLCPEGLSATPGVCRGSLGFAVVDVGGSVSPSEHFRVDAVATNVFDQSHQLRAATFAGEGVGARLVVTLRY